MCYMNIYIYIYLYIHTYLKTDKMTKLSISYFKIVTYPRRVKTFQNIDR